MPTTEEIIAAVRADVEEGLRRLLPARSDEHEGFELLGPFLEHGALIDGDFGVVQWRYRGGDVNPKGFNGLWPTAKRIEVRGLTVVDVGSDPWLFHRHVDWNAVNSQLGGSRGRNSIDWSLGSGSGDPRKAREIYGS